MGRCIVYEPHFASVPPYHCSLTTMKSIMARALALFLLLVVPAVDGCRTVRISNNYPPSHASDMTTYTRTGMTSSRRPVYSSDTSDSYLYHIPDENGRWVIGETVGATDRYTMFVKSNHLNADEITGPFFTLVHGVMRELPNVHVSCTVENVALGKPASQSSTDGSNTAGLAVDGEKGTSVPDNQCTLTNAEIGPWWEVDLGRDWSISTVRVLDRGHLPENFEVKIKNELESWESTDGITVGRGNLDNGESIVVDFERPIVGRHVRIQLPERSDTDVLSVCEVEVFPGLGCPAGYIVHGGICYKVHNTPMTRQNASATCQQDGGTLAMPRHPYINEFLVDTAIRVDTQSDYWIGLSKEKEAWLWDDGNPLCGWGPREPSTSDNCTVLRFGGSWQDESCDATAKFFCQVQPPVDLATVGYQPYGRVFLRALPEKMTFDEANAACGQFGGGRLAQPITKKFNDVLNSVVGEASDDGSFWIGLKMYEDFWLWSDGTPSESSYTGWAPGEPSGEGCVTTTSSGNWSVKNCEETAFYVCQIGDERLCETEPHSKVRCGGIFSGSSGQILSPGYGQNLNNPDELDCEWKIIVPPGKVVQFTVEYFQLEENGFLQIFDFCPYGRNVETISGTAESSLTVTTTANEAFLKFSSNGLQPTHGFNISYQAVPPPHRPFGLQNNQARLKRSAMAAAGSKAGLQGVAGFVTDILFNIADIIWNAIDNVEADERHQQIMDKLNQLENKIDDIHEEIQALGIMDELRHEKEIAAQLYSDSEQRIKNLHDTLHTRLRITVNGTLEPRNLAQEWVETVLSQDSEGMNQALNNMYDMVMGTSTVFAGTSVLETMDAILRRQNHQSSMEKLRSICEYIIDLQLSGYVAWILALKQNADTDVAEEVMNRADNKLSKQNCFMAHFFYEWPAYTYGLPNATSGCPGGSSVVFEEGQYELKGHNSFHWAEDGQLHLAGSLSNDAVKQGFCMKTTSSGSENWPKGSYCILKFGNCPVGFSWGRLGFPGGTKTGVVPDGSVGSDSVDVDYCCRDDGFSSYPVRLPSRSPFFLLRHGGECQQVEGATVREGWLEYRGNGHRAGITPDDDGGDNSHKLYFCFYSAPGYTGNIPTTQVISAAVQVHTASAINIVTHTSCAAALWVML